MKSPIGYALGALAVWATAWVVLRAEPPPSGATGRVLILDNERTLEGDVEQVGNQYRVRRPVGETWVPGETVLKLCADLSEAHAFLRSRTNLRDPDEHLKLARWCQFHGLRAEALEEARAALALSPGSAEAQSLVRGLERARTAAEAARDTERPAAEPPALPPIEISAEAVGLFATRVQPILMNTCAGCHAGAKAGAFRLTPACEGTLTNRRALQQNLAAVLGQINRSRPLSSPLLVRAVSVHGDAEQPPLKGRQAPAYHILEDWVRLATADLPSEQLPANVAGGLPEAKAVADGRPPAAAPQAQAVPIVPARLPPPGSAKPLVVSSPEPPAADPFDPAVFNRQMHPDVKPERPGPER